MPVSTLQVTLGSAATQVSSVSVPCRQVIIQINVSGHTLRVGDKNVSNTRGVLLAGGAPGGSVQLGEFSSYNVNLNEIYLFGTNTDVIDVLIVQ